MPISISVIVIAVILVHPIEHIPEEFHFDASNVDFLIPSKFPSKPLDNKACFSIHFDFQHSPGALNPNLMFASQELSSGDITSASEHVLSP